MTENEPNSDSPDLKYQSQQPEKSVAFQKEIRQTPTLKKEIPSFIIGQSDQETFTNNSEDSDKNDFNRPFNQPNENFTQEMIKNTEKGETAKILPSEGKKLSHNKDVWLTKDDEEKNNLVNFERTKKSITGWGNPLHEVNKQPEINEWNNKRSKMLKEYENLQKQGKAQNQKARIY
jgi:hypothetical protein